MMLVVLMLTLAVVGADLPDDILNEPNWGIQTYLDVDASLYCNHSTLIAQDTNVVKWKLPDGSDLPYQTDKYWMTRENGVTDIKLTVKKVKESDAGVYTCSVFTGGTNSVFRGHLLRGLNVGGHKYRDAFDEYRHDLMVGGLAALAFFVFLCGLCLIYKFRYKTLEEKQAKIAGNKHQLYLAENGTDRDVEVATTKGEENKAYAEDTRL